jgi:uncharacterized protein (TIGR00369 family)
MLPTDPRHEPRAALIDGEEFDRLVRDTIPLSRAFPWRVDVVRYGRCRLVMDCDTRHVRAGGTLSGPVLMTLADTTLYLATLSVVGPEPLAVTSDLSIRFLHRSLPGKVIADGRILRAGRRLVVGEVSMYSEGRAEPIAHVTGTYAMPAP